MICAGLDSASAGTFNGAGEELDVSPLMVSNLLPAVAREFRKSNSHEVLLGVLLEAFRVEEILKMLQRQGKIENVNICRNRNMVSQRGRNTVDQS